MIRSISAIYPGAGTGVVHDEVILVDEYSAEMTVNGMQFWINLPAAQKAEAPAYLAVQSSDIPDITLRRIEVACGYSLENSMEYQQKYLGMPTCFSTILL